MTREDFREIYSGVGTSIKHALWKYKEANSNLWVTSLCYYTVLSMIPIFAILFSIGTWLGLGEYLLKQIDNHSPIKGEAIQLLLTFTDNLLTNARSGVLAGLGFLFLIWSLISMFSIVEKAFNDIWDIDATRSFVRKISDYLTFFILLPTLILVSNASSLLIQNDFLSKILPYFSVLLFFMALFMVMPNTEVKWLPAFVASFFTSVMFSIFQYAFIYLQVLINAYNMIYGSFSVIFIFLIWLRIAWFLIILGAHLSYLLQNRDINLYCDSLSIDEINFQSKFSLAVHLLAVMVRRYQKEESLVTRAELAARFHNVIAIDGVLRILKKGNFILEGKNEKQEKVYSLAKNIEKTRLEEVYFVISSYGKMIEDIEYEIISAKRLQTRLCELGGYEEKE